MGVQLKVNTLNEPNFTFCYVLFIVLAKLETYRNHSMLVSSLSKPILVFFLFCAEFLMSCTTQFCWRLSFGFWWLSSLFWLWLRYLCELLSILTIVKLNRYLGIPCGKLKKNLLFGRKLLGRSCFVYKINIYRGEGCPNFDCSFSDRCWDIIEKKI